MSELVTIVTLEPRIPDCNFISSLKVGNVIIDIARQDFLQALWRRLGYSDSAFAIHIYGEKENGYTTSSVFIDLSDNDDESAKIHFSGKYRNDVSNILKRMFDCSKINEILVLSELTYHPVGYDPSERYDDFSIEDIVSEDGFWSLHDSGKLMERTIYEVSMTHD